MFELEEVRDPVRQIGSRGKEFENAPVKGEGRPWVSQPLMSQEEAVHILSGEMPSKIFWPDHRGYLHEDERKKLVERAWERVQMPTTLEQ